jgi:hypothetical protein
MAFLIISFVISFLFIGIVGCITAKTGFLFRMILVPTAPTNVANVPKLTAVAKRP